MRAVPAPYQPHLLSATDTLLLLRLDEAAAADAVDAAGGADFTRVGTVGSAPRLFGRAAEGQGARTFDGSSGGLHRASSAPHQTKLKSATAWTLEAWVYIDTFAGGLSQCILAHGDPDAGQASLLRVSVTSTGAIEIVWQDDLQTFTNTTSAGVIAAVRAYHVAIVRRPPESDPSSTTSCDLEVWVGTSGEDGTALTHTRVSVFRDALMATAAGGSSGRWSVGYRYGSAAAPDHLDGTIDDLRWSDFSASEACLRDSWGRGLRDFDAAKLVTQPGEGERDGGDAEVHTRVELAADDGAWVDLCDLNGCDFLLAAEWERDGEQAMMSASLELHRQHYDVSLIPEDTNGMQVYERYGKILDEDRGVRIWTATVPRDTGRGNAEPFFDLHFDGLIEKVDFGSRKVKVRALDLGKALANQWVEPDDDPDLADGQERQYGTALGQAAETVVQTIIDDNDPAVFPIVSVDDVAGKLEATVYDNTTRAGRPNSVDVDGASFRVSGTASFDGGYTLEPSSSDFTTVRSYETVGAAAAETVGTLTFGAAYSYRRGKPQVYAPTLSGMMLYTFNEAPSKNVLQAVQEKPEQIGWECRYTWDDHRKEFRLTFRDPRSVSNSVRGSVFLGYGVHEVLRAQIAKEDVRNVAVGTYEDPNDLDESNLPRRKTEVYVDAVSAKEHGRRYCGLAVGATSHIKSAAEMYEAVSNMGRDLSTPFTEWDLELPYRGEIEVGNLWNFVRYGGEQVEISGDVNNYRSVASVRHRIDRKRLRTTLGVRNQIALGPLKKWRDSKATRGRNPTKGTRPPPAPAGITLIGAIDSIIVRMDEPSPLGARRQDKLEVFYSTTNGFGLSGNFKASTRGTYVQLGALTPGVDYFFRFRFRDAMGNVSEPSIQYTTKPTSGGGGGPGYGDVVGPASSTDRAIATFDSTTGKLLRDNASTKVLSSGAVLVKDAAAGMILFDGTNYHRFTANARGALVTTPLGSSEPTT